MADLTTLLRSPLAHLTEEMRASAVSGPRAVRLVEWPFVTMISVRVEPSSDAARSLESVLGLGLPRTCGEVTEQGPHSVLWLGPDEWLLVSRAEATALTRELQDAVAQAHASVVDVSANRTVLELSGPSARAVLEKGCPVDLHPAKFVPGTAVTSTLARIPLLVWQVAPDAYRLLPRSSFADYVARWLLDAMQEFQSPLQGTGVA